MTNKECSNCPHTDKCREVWAEENRGPLTSGGLAVCSAVAFLLPIFAAIIVGTIARAGGSSEKVQILFSLLGFVLGGVFAATIVSYSKNKFNRQYSDEICTERESGA